MNEKISHSFLDAFISMDNACKDALKSNKNLENLSFSGNGGVTVYINQLVELRFAPERNEVLQRLVGAGNTVIVIEHNLDLIKTADHIIDMGPEGGDKGGTVVVCGTPEEVAMCEKSYTRQYLKKILEL